METFLKALSDPRNRAKPNWIHSSMPNVNARGFDGYPFIVLGIDLNEENKSFDFSTSNKIFRALIQVYSDEATEVDSISDEIVSDLKDETLLSDFDAREVASSPINWNLDQNGKKILFRNIGLILRRRL